MKNVNGIKNYSPIKIRFNSIGDSSLLRLMEDSFGMTISYGQGGSRGDSLSEPPLLHITPHIRHANSNVVRNLYLTFMRL